MVGGYSMTEEEEEERNLNFDHICWMRRPSGHPADEESRLLVKELKKKLNKDYGIINLSKTPMNGIQLPNGDAYIAFCNDYGETTSIIAPTKIHSDTDGNRYIMLKIVLDNDYMLTKDSFINDLLEDPT